MSSNPTGNDEIGRIRALERLQVLDTEPEEPFENVVSLVKAVLNVPMCAISLVEKRRQWFKAQRGLGVKETPIGVSFCRYTIRTSGAFVVEDTLTDERFVANQLVTGEPYIRSYVGFPLQTSDGYNVGSLCAIDTKPRHFTPEELSILEYLSNIVIQELELRHAATTDEMTGALSRRGWLREAERELRRAIRHERPLSLMIFDIDRFKQINDSYGHAAGDLVIRRLAKLCRQNIRGSDIFGRLGGEEFGVLMPETCAYAAAAVADRVRTHWSTAEIDVGCSALTSTISVGVAELTAEVNDLSGLMERADRALYLAKQNGRNETIVYSCSHSTDPWSKSFNPFSLRHYSGC